VGYWIPIESDPELGISAENTFIYIRGYPSKEERDKRLKAAHDDPEFKEVVTKQEEDPATKLVVKAHNIDMLPNGTHTTITLTK
jgi:NIPSNAP